VGVAGNPSRNHCGGATRLIYVTVFRLRKSGAITAPSFRNLACFTLTLAYWLLHLFLVADERRSLPCWRNEAERERNPAGRVIGGNVIAIEVAQHSIAALFRFNLRLRRRSSASLPAR